MAMKATEEKYSEESTRARAQERWREERRRENELATLAAHLSAATARFVELAWEFRAQVDSDDFAGWLGYRCGSPGVRRGSSCVWRRRCGSCR